MRRCLGNSCKAFDFSRGLFTTQLCLDDLRKLVNDGNYEDCKEFALVAKQNAETVCNLVFELMEANKEEDDE